MIETYCELHQRGIAKSVEVWKNKKLVGGLYGIELDDTIFCGESMFSYVSNASKIGFISFVQNSNYKIIDCQLHTNHLESLGAEPISRLKFMEYLKPQNHNINN
jgi:leucyl/phenylalanyl-tRNA--protein transferase